MTQTLEAQLKGAASIAGKPLFAPLEITLTCEGWTCLLGPSGVGKTTLLRLFAGLSVGAEFEGEITGPRAVAYMGQEDLLLPWASVRGNITLGARMRGKPAEQGRLAHLLEATGLSAHAEKKPHELSGGQRQRVALARTLMEDRPLVLLDEPFSALDARTRAEMQELAHRLLRGRIVLLVTHDPAEAVRLGDQILLLNEAGLHSIAPPDGLAPREVDDVGAFQVQGALMRRLREE